MILVVEIEENSRTRIVELSHSTSLVGRSSQCAVRFRSDVVSGQHAQLVISKDSVTIQDLGSSNGVFLNHARLGKQPVPIGLNSVLQFGSDGPLMTILEGPSLATKPAGKASTKTLLAAVGCLVVCLAFCIVGLLLTSGAVLFSDPDLLAYGTVTKIQNNREQLSEAVGLVVVGFYGVGQDGKSRVARRGTGTCFAVTPDGFVFTNQHVVEEAVEFAKSGKIKMKFRTKNDDVVERVKDHSQLERLFGFTIESEKVWVILNQKVFEAKIVHVSNTYDFSILKIETEEMPFFRLYNDNEVPSIDVFALGFPAAASLPIGGGERMQEIIRDRIPHYSIRESVSQSEMRHSVSDSVVNRVKIEDSPKTYWIQHNAEIGPGSSGGPLCTKQGVVVGLNTIGLIGKNTNFSVGVKQLEGEIQTHVPNVQWVNP